MLVVVVARLVSGLVQHDVVLHLGEGEREGRGCLGEGEREGRGCLGEGDEGAR